MIDYIRDMAIFSRPIDKFPYIIKGPIAIIWKSGGQRYPAWGWGKTIVKVDKKCVYVKSVIKGKIDLFNEHGDKVKQISADELK